MGVINQMKEKHGLFQLTLKLFIRKNDHLLILKDKKSQVGDLPGGRMNQDEFYMDWTKSIEREIKEELGKEFFIELNQRPFLIHKHHVDIENASCIFVGYHAKYLSGELKLSNEHDYSEWSNVYEYNPEGLFKGYFLDIMKLYLNEYK